MATGSRSRPGSGDRAKVEPAFHPDLSYQSSPPAAHRTSLTVSALGESGPGQPLPSAPTRHRLFLSLPDVRSCIVPLAAPAAPSPIPHSASPPARELLLPGYERRRVWPSAPPAALVRRASLPPPRQLIRPAPHRLPGAQLPQLLSLRGPSKRFELAGRLSLSDLSAGRVRGARSA